MKLSNYLYLTKLRFEMLRMRVASTCIKKYGKREFVLSDENRSESEGGLYVAFVRRAVGSQKVFSSFKRHPSYQSILEHVSKADGEAYLRVIEMQSPDFMGMIEKFKENDLIGNPISHVFPGVGRISPTTLRYMKVASDLKKYFGVDFGKKIIEVGVGYGGQMLVLDKVFSGLDYTLIDLPPVLDLTSRYLESHILNGSYSIKTLNQMAGNLSYDLVVSNYAFSELPPRLQEAYIKKIFSKSKRGYLTMNSGFESSTFSKNHLSIDELRRLLPSFEIMEELPLTAEGNYIIVWGHCEGNI